MMLTPREWNSLVERLNRSSRAKQMHVLQAQHKQMTDELTGLTFTPAISERSRELAAHNKALPERMAALMRKKKARLDKIRHEKACKELEEATFRPRVNDYKPSRAAQNARNVERKITHLMQYVSGLHGSMCTLLADRVRVSWLALSHPRCTADCKLCCVLRVH